MELHKAILKARRTWNSAAHKSRELPEVAAADELYQAAQAIVVLLGEHVALVEDDGENQDDYDD